MKIIEGMKLIKELQQKASDLRNKVKMHAADLDFETPVYQDQKKQIREWIQSHSDIQKEILKLRVAIQRVNLKTKVDVQLNGKVVTKTIAEWIHRRRDLAGNELAMWAALTDKGLKEGQIPSSTSGAPPREVKLRRYYDPAERDLMVSQFQAEPNIIDRTLEVVNAVTDLD